MQGVVSKNDVSEEVFEVAKSIGQESSLYVTGKIVEDHRSELGYEMQVNDIKVIQETHDYPITPKEHGTEFLMNHRHIRLRSRRQHAIMKIRNKMIKSTYDYFYSKDFVKIVQQINTRSTETANND